MKENLGFGAEADRMKGLLVDAITTLCRNGLHYRAGLKVEGLIGITLDEEDIILVSVNRTFTAEGYSKNRATPSSDEEDTSHCPLKPDRSPKKSEDETPTRCTKRRSCNQSYSVTKSLKQCDSNSGAGNEYGVASTEVEPGEVTMATVRVENTSWIAEDNQQPIFPQAVTVHTQEGSESVPVKIEVSDDEEDETNLVASGAMLQPNFSQSGSAFLACQSVEPQNMSDVMFMQSSLGVSQTMRGLSGSGVDDMQAQPQENVAYQVAGGGRSHTQKVKVLPVVSGGRRCFKCKACNIICSTPQNMQNHLALYHPGGYSIPHLWNCKLCSYTSPRKANLVRHMRLVHKTVVSCQSISSGVADQQHEAPSLEFDSGVSDVEMAKAEQSKIPEHSGLAGTSGPLIEHVTCVKIKEEVNTSST